jgi:hypothetical protein
MFSVIPRRTYPPIILLGEMSLQDAVSEFLAHYRELAVT